MRFVALRPLIGLSFCVALAQSGFAQAPFPKSGLSENTLRGVRLYRGGNTGAALQSFEAAAKTPLPPTPGGEFFYADLLQGYGLLAGIKTEDSFLTAKAEMAWNKAVMSQMFRDRIAAALSEAAFYRGDWEKTAEYGAAAGYHHHSNAELATIKFRTAYAYLNQKDLEKAEPLFRAMKGVEGPYKIPAYYYYGLLAYQQNRYDEALRNLQQVADEPRYRSTVPYFVAELKYLKGDKEGALSDAKSLLAAPEKSYYQKELQLLAAQVLYDEGKYSEALPYFEAYYDAADALRRETLYEIGYSYFATKAYPQAISRLKPVTAGEDSLAQLSAVLLGDAYLLSGDRAGARAAYTLASGHDFFPQLQQASMLKAAALLYEAGRDGEAQRILARRSELYPAADDDVEVKNLRAAIALRSGQYRAALDVLEGQTAAPRYTAIMQRASYGLGVQQLQLGELAGAENLLRRSLSFGENGRYKAAASFWLSETAYRLGHYEDAVRYADAYLSQISGISRPITGAEVSPAAAELTKGYALLALKDYTGAQSAFALAKRGGGAIAANAAIREADAALMQRNFAQAQQLYQQAATLPKEEEDYALLQQATLLGLQGKLGEKQQLLQQIYNRVPTSLYAAEARYEAGLNLIGQNKYRDAVAVLTPLTAGTPFASKAYLRLGYSQAELNDTKAAIAAYTRVLEIAPGTADAQAALEALRGIYTEAGQPDAYAALVAKIGAGNGASGVDSVFYTAAETQFAANKFDKAATAYEDYLTRYPEGSFAPKAAFYGGQSYDRVRNYASARRLYEKVLTYPANEFTAQAAQRLAVLASQDSDTAAAQRAYEALLANATSPVQTQQAQLGLLRIYSQQDNYEAVTPLADSLLQNATLDAATKTQVALYRANAAAGTGDTATALRYWEQSKNSKLPAVSAEASYHLAAAALGEGSLSKAESTAMAAIRISGAPEWWNVKSYMVLAEVFRQQKDYFNARATLESIVKNAKNAELKAEAKAQLERVVAEEKTSKPTKGK